jgi:hypothetical protein
VATTTKRLTQRQRQAIIDKPIILLNHRTIHPVKRWAGVFVADNFGENRKPALQRLPGMTGDCEGTVEVGMPEPITQFDSSFYIADMVLWERIGGEPIV